MSGNGEGYQDGLGDDPVSKVVVDIIAAQYRVDESEVYRDSNLFSDLGGDSLDLVNIEMEIENEFNLSIENLPDDVMNRWKTVQEAVEYVQTHAREQ